MSDFKIHFETLEKEAEILKRIAERYPPSSQENAAIEHAALALNYALTEDFERFSAFVRHCGQELTPTQKAFLTKLGLTFE